LKTLTPEEIERRTAQLARVRAKRWPKHKRKRKRA
jgi:hypothetical protein